MKSALEVMWTKSGSALKDNLLLLSSRSNKTVELLAIDFIHKINISGSPFKGSEDALVVIAVFSDFQ